MVTGDCTWKVSVSSAVESPAASTLLPPTNHTRPPPASLLSGWYATTLLGGVPAGSTTVVPVAGRYSRTGSCTACPVRFRNRTNSRSRRLGVCTQVAGWLRVSTRPLGHSAAVGKLVVTDVGPVIVNCARTQRVSATTSTRAGAAAAPRGAVRSSPRHPPPHTPASPASMSHMRAPPVAMEVPLGGRPRPACGPQEPTPVSYTHLTLPTSDLV